MSTERSVYKRPRQPESAETLHKRGAEAIHERATVAPLVDVFENDEEVLLVADLPGVSQAGLNLAFENGQLTLQGHREEEPTKELLAGEYRVTDYRRAFLVPEGVAADKISAELKNGVLSVHLPKAAPLQPRKIQVKAS